ncbi:MAG: rod shape-determining protein, partial [Patescibacteria group bacterium]
TVSAGARSSYLVPEPLAAAVGAEIPVSEPRGHMIINSGGGATEVAVISLGGVVVQGSVRVAGNRIDEAIADHLRREYNLTIGEQTAEAIKIEIGSALPLPENISREVKGRDSVSGLPKVVEVTSHEITAAMERPLSEMVAVIQSVLEKTPPELASDVIDRGMVLAGGTSMLRGLNRRLTQATGVPVHVADEPLLCVIKGCGEVIRNLEVFKKHLTMK